MVTGYLNIPKDWHTNNYHLVWGLLFWEGMRAMCIVFRPCILVPTSPRPLHGCALCQTWEHAAELRLCQLPADRAGGPAGLSSPAPAPLFPAQHQHGLPAQCQVPAAGVRCMHAWVRPGSMVGQARSWSGPGGLGTGPVFLERNVCLALPRDVMKLCFVGVGLREE